MPYGYRRRKVTTRKRTTTVRGGVRPRLAPMPRRPKRKTKSFVRTNSMHIRRLQRSVARLKSSEFGQIQIMRQTVRSTIGLPSGVLARVSSDFPVCWCHQLIGEGTQIFQATPSAGPGPVEINAGLVGRWVQQPMPLAATYTNAEVFNTMKYRQINNLGVQIPYLHMKSVYSFTCVARLWEGWFNVLLVEPRKQFTRQGTPLLDDFQLPGVLPGFSNTTPGSTPNEWQVNPMMFSIKVLKRVYFNTQSQVNNSQLHTNPQRSFRVVVNNHKYKSHIRAQKDATLVTPAITTHADIALHQQTWIVLTASNIAPPTADSALDVYVKRSNTFRDFLGGS